MNVAKQSLVWFLLVLLFVGNVGIGVFKHVCAEDGVVVSYFINEGDEHCKSHEVEKQAESCCHDDAQESDDDCCHDEVDYLKLKVDAERTNLDQLVALTYILPTASPIVLEAEAVNPQLPNNYINPPPPDSRELRTQKQVWII